MITFDIKLIVSTASLIFALYESRKRKKLETINRQNTWSFYRDASVVLAVLQGLQEKIRKYNDADCMLELGKGHLDVFNKLAE